MRELAELSNQYIKDHPNSINPMQVLYTYGVERLIEILNNAKGREIVFSDEGGADDGGKFKYID